MRLRICATSSYGRLWGWGGGVSCHDGIPSELSLLSECPPDGGKFSLRHVAITEVLDVTSEDFRAAQRFCRLAKADILKHYDDNRDDLGGNAAKLIAPKFGQSQAKSNPIMSGGTSMTGVAGVVKRFAMTKTVTHSNTDVAKQIQVM